MKNGEKLREAPVRDLDSSITVWCPWAFRYAKWN